MSSNPPSPAAPFTTADEVFSFFGSFTNFERRQKHDIREYRLDRMYYLLDLFDRPQGAMKILHVAGSKGKGSTSLQLAVALEATGERVGLYSSPHVQDYRERISLAGSFIDDKEIVDEGNRILERMRDIRSPALDGSEDPTTFELLTLLAFLLFRRIGCSYAVIETGIGGRLDATNVVEPVASLITPIELEHTDVLGNSLAEIAWEKAGIIKKGRPVIVSPQHPEVIEVIERRAAEMEAPLLRYDRLVELSSLHFDRGGTVIAAKIEGLGALHLRTGMLGAHQAANVLLALTLLTKLGLIGSEDVPRLSEALERTRMPGRLELLGDEQPFVLDGAHTPASVALVLEAYRELFPEPPVCVFGSVLGKNVEGMAELLSPFCEELIISRPGSFKPSDPTEVYRCFKARRADAQLLEDPAEAMRRALELSRSHGTRPILVTGSFYMVAEIRPLALSHCPSGERLIESRNGEPHHEHN